MSNSDNFSDEAVAGWVRKKDKELYMWIIGGIATTEVSATSLFIDIVRQNQEGLSQRVSNPLFLIFPFMVFVLVVMLFIFWTVIRRTSAPKPVAGMEKQGPSALAAIQADRDMKKHQQGYLCLLDDAIAWGTYNKKAHTVEMQETWDHKNISRIKLLKDFLSYAYALLIFDDGTKKLFRVSNVDEVKKYLRTINS